MNGMIGKHRPVDPDADGQLHRPSDVAVDEEGYIYVADWGNKRVQVLDREGSYVLKLRGAGDAVQVGGGVLRLKSRRDPRAREVEPGPAARPRVQQSVPDIRPDRALLLGTGR